MEWTYNSSAIEGNDRTARLLLNFELIKLGYLPVVIKVAQRLENYEALDLAQTTGNLTDFYNLVAKYANNIAFFTLGTNMVKR